MDHFELVSQYKPTGDQPQAIEDLVKGFKEGNQCQTLLGVTGSGKTFTMANVIQQINKPTLVIAHNKTLAAQLYGEFKEFFPNNAVEYFVSYYDYYQPVQKDKLDIVRNIIDELPEKQRSCLQLYRISKPAAWLMLPYLVWVAFAGYLNLGVWWLNR